MKNKGFLMFFAIFLLGTMSLGAQQEGAVAIAGSIRLDGGSTLSEMAECAIKLNGAGMNIEKAVNSCQGSARDAFKAATKIANEAADATKASRPIILSNSYGHSYGSSYYGGRSYYERPVVHRSPVVRRPPPPRRTPTPRQPVARPAK